MDGYMFTPEKVLNFLKNRKTPVTSKELAHHFLLNTSTINRALAYLENTQHAKRIKTKGSHQWVYCHNVRVAIPENTNKESQSAASLRWSRPIQNSYPNVRGYDD